MDAADQRPAQLCPHGSSYSPSSHGGCGSVAFSWTGRLDAAAWQVGTPTVSRATAAVSVPVTVAAVAALLIVSAAEAGQWT